MGAQPQGSAVNRLSGTPPPGRLPWIDGGSALLMHRLAEFELTLPEDIARNDGVAERTLSGR
jgi:hypothetical protein